MRRTRSERRHNDWAKIHRKMSIIRNTYSDSEDDLEYYQTKPHRLNKNKIPTNSKKTKDVGYKTSDYRKFESLQASIEETDIRLNVLPKRGD